MGKLFDVLAAHKWDDATFRIGKKTINLKVKLLSGDAYRKEIVALCSPDEKANAARLAALFKDASTLEAAFTVDELLSPEVSNADVQRLIQLFVEANNGLIQPDTKEK